MSEATADAPDEPTKKGGKALIIGIISALLAAGGGFFSTYSGFAQSLAGTESSDATHHDSHATEEVQFVALEPIIISYPGSPGHQFRISAQLEVPPHEVKEVSHLMPRVLDVLNGFLRALDPTTLSDRAAWYDLRLKMLYRIRMVLGEDRVRDLLITEFVLH